MKRVLVLVVILTLVGGGIAFAIADTGDPTPAVQARIAGQTTPAAPVATLTTTIATRVVETTPAATPAATDAPETPVDASPVEGSPQANADTFAEDSASSSSQVVLQPVATPSPAIVEADTLAQNALAALKQFLVSPEAGDTYALTDAVKALDGAIAQIEALGLPIEQQQSEVAVLLLARAHLLELMTQIASQNKAHPQPTPTPRRSSSGRGNFFLGGSRNNVPDVVSNFKNAPGQP